MTVPSLSWKHAVFGALGLITCVVLLLRPQSLSVVPARQLHFNVNVNHSSFIDCIKKGVNQDLDAWFASNAQESKVYTRHELNPEAVMVDIGGFTGDQLKVFYDRYHPFVYVFEPIKKYYDVLVDKFSPSKGKVVAFNYGIAQQNTSVFFVEEGDRSRFVPQHQDGAQEVQLRTFDEVFYSRIASQHGGMIDLLHINCEGCEYDVLDYIISAGWHTRMKNILVQFHNYGDSCGHEAVYRRCRLRSLLADTHTEDFNYPFVWEGWRLKDA